MHLLTIFLIRRGLLAALLLTTVALALLVGCGRVETTIKGRTMGTTYMVKVVADRLSRTSHLKPLIEARLEGINGSMSTYLPDSEINRFNAITQAGLPLTPSDDLLAVMRIATEIHAATGGAWDGSLYPLVNLWGFGPERRGDKVPTAAEIESLLPLVGFDRIAITADNQLVKADGRMTLDLASIAKGYGVDAVARLLEDQGYSDFLVEVGGEVYAAGKRTDGQSWRVGINRPDRAAGFSEVYKVVSLSNRGFATSGDYRNYFLADGRLYSHILDPRTGWPVTNGVVSASVLAESCTLADGLATALMVMGPEAGLALVEQLTNVEALVIVRGENGDLSEFASKGFNARPLN